MTTERTFGRRGAGPEPKTRVFRAKVTEPVEVVLVKRKKLTVGQIGRVADAVVSFSA